MTDDEQNWSIQRPFWAIGLLVLFFVGAAIFGRGGRNPGDPPPMGVQPEAGQIIAIRYGTLFAYYDDEFLKSTEQGEDAFGFTLSQTAPGENVSAIEEAATILIDRGEPKIVSRGRSIPRRNVMPMGMPWRQTFEVSGTRLTAAEFLYAPPATAGDEEKRLAKQQGR